MIDRPVIELLREEGRHAADKARLASLALLTLPVLGAMLEFVGLPRAAACSIVLTVLTAMTVHGIFPQAAASALAKFWLLLRDFRLLLQDSTRKHSMRLASYLEPALRDASTSEPRLTVEALEGVVADVAVASALDEDLAPRAQSGDVAAFEEIIKRYQRRVYLIALRLVRRPDIAEDVAQETFLRVYQAFPHRDPSRQVGPWICRIAANIAITEMHTERATPTRESLDEGTVWGAPGEGALEEQARRVIGDALDELSSAERVLIRSRLVEGMSYEDIARVLAISPAEVRLRLSQLQQILTMKALDAFSALSGRVGLRHGAVMEKPRDELEDLIRRAVRYVS